MSIMAKRLEDYRMERYMTVAEFAALLDIAIHTFYSIVKGRRRPRFSTMKKIAQKLEVKPSDIEEFVHKPRSD